MKVSSRRMSVAPPKTTMMARLAHCMGATFLRRASTHPICAMVTAMASPVATKMSATLKATKKTMTGRKSKRNFTVAFDYRRKNSHFPIASRVAAVAFLDAFAHGRSDAGRQGAGERLGVEARALVRERRVQQVERGIDRVGILRADRGDREVRVQQAPWPLGVGA